MAKRFNGMRRQGRLSGLEKNMQSRPISRDRNYHSSNLPSLDIGVGYKPVGVPALAYQLVLVHYGGKR